MVLDFQSFFNFLELSFLQNVDYRNIDSKNIENNKPNCKFYILV